MEKLHPTVSVPAVPAPTGPADGPGDAAAPAPATPSALPATDAPAPAPADVRAAAEELAARLQEARPGEWRVGFREDADTGSLVIEIRDAAGDLIKQLPPEKVLNLRRRLDDLAGVVVDEAT